MNICFTGGICTPKNKHAKESFLIAINLPREQVDLKRKHFLLKAEQDQISLLNAYLVSKYLTPINLCPTPHTNAIAACHNFTKCSSF